jgi:hypothetical protein
MKGTTKMKTKFKIETPFGTVTRTSARNYTHIVVCAEATKPHPNPTHAGEVRIFNAKKIKGGTGYLVGFASSHELARRLCNSWEIQCSEQIVIVEITDAMKS